MKKSIIISSLVASTLALSACGGGGGSVGNNAPTQNPPAQNTPAANTGSNIANLQTGTLSARAKAGTKTQLAAGITRSTNTFKLDGQTGTVSVDTIEGAGDVLVQYTLKDKATVFDVTGKTIATTKLPSGDYNGPLDFSYRTSGNGKFQAAAGKIGISLDTSTGEALIGGITSSATNNIEIFGDATVANGKLSDTDTVVRLRDKQGNFIKDFSGTTTGILVDGKKDDAIVGKIGVKQNGLELKGGFTATPFN